MAQRTTNKTNGKSRSSSKSLKVSAASKTKSGTKKAGRTVEQASVGDEEVTVDRRRKAGRRADDVQSKPEVTAVAAPQLERRLKVNRRRQIDPTTCERDYTDGEVEFMSALDDYKRTSGRMFPTCSEVLEVVRSLGYVKLSAAELAICQERAVFAPVADGTSGEWSDSEDSLFDDGQDGDENE